MPKHQPAATIAKRISAEHIPIGLHRNNLRLPITTLKKIVLNHRLTIARIRIVRIPLRNKLKRLVPIAPFAIWNIDKMIVMNMVPSRPDCERKPGSIGSRASPRGYWSYSQIGSDQFQPLWLSALTRIHLPA